MSATVWVAEAAAKTLARVLPGRASWAPIHTSPSPACLPCGVRVGGHKKGEHRGQSGQVQGRPQAPQQPATQATPTAAPGCAAQS